MKPTYFHVSSVCKKYKGDKGGQFDFYANLGITQKAVYLIKNELPFKIALEKVF
jgi:hypothetical protein